jgi:hypothetical protein
LTNGNLVGGFLLFTNIGPGGGPNTLTNLDAGTLLGPTNFLAIAINSNNGLVTINFQPTGGKTNVARGAVLQNQTNAQGAFPGPTQTGSFILH